MFFKPNFAQLGHFFFLKVIHSRAARVCFCASVRFAGNIIKWTYAGSFLLGKFTDK